MAVHSLGMNLWAAGRTRVKDVHREASRTWAASMQRLKVSVRVSLLRCYNWIWDFSIFYVQIKICQGQNSSTSHGARSAQHKPRHWNLDGPAIDSGAQEHFHRPCGGFNENGSQRLMCLNSWPSVGRTV